MIRLDRFRAKSFFNTGEYEKALILYEKVVKVSKTSRDRMSLARIYLKAGRFDDAEAQLRKLNLADLNAVEGIQAKISLAQTIWRKGDLKDAIRRVELIFQTEKITLVYATLGYLYIVAGDKKALDFNQEAYAYNPANAEIGDNLGECLLATKDYALSLIHI